MRYPPGHKQEKRKELLSVSGALIKTHGFSATGVDKLTQGAGVTSGSFYSHFGSKTELLKALIGNELQISRDMWAGNPHNTAEEWVNFELDRYLSMGHVNHPESGCIIPALGAEIARADNSVKALYAQELHKGIVILATRLGSEAQAFAFICQMVGAIVMARAMPSSKEKKTILESSKLFLQHALQSQHKTRPKALPH